MVRVRLLQNTDIYAQAGEPVEGLMMRDNIRGSRDDMVADVRDDDGTGREMKERHRMTKCFPGCPQILSQTGGA